MRLRPYQKRDAAVIADWSTDERTPECFAFQKEKWGRIRMELVVADV